jgi:hypothetical protein
VDDSRVFWNQASPGFPRVIAQRCFNRHGSFLLVEEYAGSRKSGVVLVPEGRRGEGWDLFGSALRCVNEYLRDGGSRVDARLEVQSQALRGREEFCRSLEEHRATVGDKYGRVLREGSSGANLVEKPPGGCFQDHCRPSNSGSSPGFRQEDLEENSIHA